MTKNTDTPVVNEVDALDQALTFDQHIDQAVAKVRQTDVAIAELKKNLELKFTDISDRANYHTMVEAEKKVRNLRYGIERRRKELVEPATKFQKAVNAAAKDLTADVEPIELHLKAEIQKHDDAEAAHKAAEVQRKTNLLIEAGFKFDGYMSYVCGVHMVPASSIATMEDGKIEYYCNEAKAIMEQQRIAEERRQAELERLEAERKAADEERRKMEEERRELERLRAEIEAAKRAAEPAPAPVELPPIENPFQPQPEQTVLQNFKSPTPAEPTTATVGHNTRSAEYIDGFEHCRAAVLELFADGVKRNRAEFVELINALKP